MQAAERALQRGAPALSRVLRAACSPTGILSGQGPPSNALSLQAASAASLGPTGAQDRSSLYCFSATPSGDLTSQSSFLRLLASSPEPASGFRGRYLEAERLQMQQLGGDISAKHAESCSWGEGSSESEIAETPPTAVTREEIRRASRGRT